MMLRMTRRLVNDINVLDCSGRIVFGDETSALRDEVTDIVASGSSLVLNLAGVNYIDSGGLGTLVSLFTSAKKNGGSIKLASLTQRVGDLMQVTKLLTVFEVYDTEEQALRAFRPGAAA